MKYLKEMRKRSSFIQIRTCAATAANINHHSTISLTKNLFKHKAVLLNLTTTRSGPKFSFAFYKVHIYYIFNVTLLSIKYLHWSINTQTQIPGNTNLSCDTQSQLTEGFVEVDHDGNAPHHSRNERATTKNVNRKSDVLQMKLLSKRSM